MAGTTIHRRPKCSYCTKRLTTREKSGGQAGHAVQADRGEKPFDARLEMVYIA
jgi:transcriptional regulator NrdR family protein